jgi:NAD(P)-dependent dehydrogenase (short-subunit alcohol dehydrogenase family)
VPEAEREAMYKDQAERLPVKHVGTADEIAEAYLFAMKCTYLTGQTIYVEGGSLLL